MDQVLALRLGHKRLQFGCRECIYQASLGDNQKKDLGTREDGKFICLDDGDEELAWRLMRRVVQRLTFFMMPALRLEKVMCRRDLSVINLISILRRSRPPFSSSSSSSSAAAETRGRLVPRDSPLPVGSSLGEPWSSCEGSVMSAITMDVTFVSVSGLGWRIILDGLDLFRELVMKREGGVLDVSSNNQAGSGQGVPSGLVAGLFGGLAAAARNTTTTTLIDCD